MRVVVQAHNLLRPVPGLVVMVAVEQVFLHL
jgi:hypothetical protein